MVLLGPSWHGNPLSLSLIEEMRPGREELEKALILSRDRSDEELGTSGSHNMGVDDIW